MVTLINDASPQEAVPGMNRQGIEAELLAHHAACFGWALNCCRWNREEALDVLQISYLKVLDGRARFDGRSAFRTWLFGVVRHTAMEHRRHEAMRLSRLAGWILREPPPASDGTDASATSQLGEEAGMLREALAALPQRQREVLHLVFYQDMSVDDAARVMRVSAGTARRHYDRAKIALRRMLAPVRREASA
jgi:RNA polymerase sigma-70 factor (ECF subfamily)